MLKTTTTKAMYATTNNIILAVAYHRRTRYLDPHESPMKLTTLVVDIMHEPREWALRELDFHLATQRLSVAQLMKSTRCDAPSVQVKVMDPNDARKHQVLELCEVPCQLVGSYADYIQCVIELTRAETSNDYGQRRMLFKSPEGHPTLLAQVMDYAPPGSETFHDALSELHGVGMVFELAGMPCPRAIDKWHLVKREFDPSQGVPYICAGVRGSPHLGSVTCIATDHELALVLGANMTRVRLVHIEALEDAMMDTIKAFVARNSKDGSKPKAPRKAREVVTPSKIDALSFL